MAGAFLCARGRERDTPVLDEIFDLFERDKRNSSPESKNHKGLRGFLSRLASDDDSDDDYDRKRDRRYRDDDAYDDDGDEHRHGRRRRSE
jgi:hypothetical protein